MYNIVIGRGKQFIHCREAVHSSECALSGCQLFSVCIIFLQSHPYRLLDTSTIAASSKLIATIHIHN